MNVTRWTQHHRRSILFLLALLAGGGLFAAFSLPVSLFPNVDFPRVVVSLDSGDRPAEQMALQVTMPVEEAIRRIPGVKNVRSTTSRGSAEVSLNFGWGTDMAAAALQVNAAVSQILPTLPAGTRLETRRMDPTVFPVIAYSLTSDSVPLTGLRDLAQYQIRPLLSAIDGVARVQVVGGAMEEYQVLVDPARLQAYNLSMDDVSKALSAANVITAVGRLEDHYKLYLAIADTRFHNREEIGQTVLKTGSDGVIRLEAVAAVRRSVSPQWLRVNADGHDAVLFQIYQQPGGNSVRIAQDVKNRLGAFQAHLPPGVKIANWYDQSELVVDSATSVRDAILIGIGLAAAVLWIFLRNGKVTLIAVLVVPAVLATTVVLLHVLDMSFNIMTLGGMAAAVGLIIDDAIVMVEHIMRRLQEGALPHHERVMNAALEFFRPLAGSSGATLVIFAPLAFLSGVTGAFFKALSITMASGLFISFLVTWLAVPILADHWLTERDAEIDHGGRLTAWFHARYEAAMGKLLVRPLWLLVGLLPLLLAGLLAYNAVGSGFMPAMDEGGFILDYRSPPGTSLAETDRLLRQVEDIVKANPNVATYSRRTGTQLGGGLTEANEGDFFIRLKSGPRAPIDEVMDQIRSRVEKEVPGLDIELAQLMEDLIGDLTAVPQPIEVKIFSDDPAQLAALAKKTAAAIGRISGVVDVRNGINPAGDALEIHVDRIKAALEGVDPDSVTRMVGNILGGNVTTEIQQGPKMVGVRVWTPAVLRDTDTKLDRLQLRAPDGHLFPLKRVAEIVAVSGQPQISRENLKRMVAVTARISGRDMGSAVREVKQAMDAPGMLPAGMYYELGGLYKQQQIAFRGLLAVLAAAVALVFLLLLFLYERFRVALSVMAIPVLSLSAVFVGLWATGIELNISAMMGMTMIVGIVTEVAIFYFSEYQALAGTMPRRKALILAGKNRMRPIAMTTLAAILTLLPLALAIGRGSAMQQPLAVAIISGLAVQLPLVLVVMPVLFDLSQKWRRRGAD
ncbi:MAG TPA: efflux RND transporter permease subunit [Sulfuricella sp.]|nr:efflux RND transporter permease subunit [Sulfuricella sp.]